MQFCVKLVKAGINTKIINTYAKDKNLIQESNKIQKKRTKKKMAKAPRIPKHFSLANMQKRIQNMDISKTPTRDDLADVIVMLSMRPAEVRSLQINIMNWIHRKYQHGIKKTILGIVQVISKAEEKRRKILCFAHFFL